MDELEALGDVEAGWSHESDVDSDGYGGRRCLMDGATSGARSDLKRVDIGSLAEEKTNQHGQRKRSTTGIPGPSAPPTIDPIHLTKPVNPPRR